MRIQHPRATDAVGGWPADAVALPHADRTPVTDGYVDVPDEHADAAMDALEEVYDVEYNRNTGEVVTDDDDAPADGDVPPKGVLKGMVKEDVYDIAAEQDVTGRSEMTKTELIAALQED